MYGPRECPRAVEPGAGFPAWDVRVKCVFLTFCSPTLTLVLHGTVRALSWSTQEQSSLFVCLMFVIHVRALKLQQCRVEIEKERLSKLLVVFLPHIFRQLLIDLYRSYLLS